jgi:DUF177 domain-containing protein
VTVGPADDRPLAWNVAGLLADSPGSDRTEVVEDARIDLGSDLRLARPLEGRVRMQRTNRGILVRAHLTTALALVCSRCLRDLAFPVDVDLEEEFLPSIDLTTGRSLDDGDEPDVARLTDHHELDLETATRESIQLAEPIAPLCRPDCPGLCPVCGERLDEGPHDHPDDDIDPRLEALRAFRADDG